MVAEFSSDLISGGRDDFFREYIPTQLASIASDYMHEIQEFLTVGTSGASFCQLHINVNYAPFAFPFLDLVISSVLSLALTDALIV